MEQHYQINPLELILEDSLGNEIFSDILTLNEVQEL